MKIARTKLKQIIKEEMELLNEGWYPNEQFGGKGSPFGGYLYELTLDSWGKDYTVWFRMHGNDDWVRTHENGGQKPFIVPNSKEVNKLQFGDNSEMYYKWQKELERKVKQKFRKDTLKTRKEIEKLVVNEFEKITSKYK